MSPGASRWPLPPRREPARPAPDGTPLLELTGIVKHFPVRNSSLLSREHRVVHAVDGVSLQIRDGETLGLVGETGCGKSTLARTIARLQPVTEGRVSFAGRDITGLRAGDLKAVRREVQMVFQDPYGSLNPRRRVGAIVGEPLAVHGLASGAARRERVQELMALVGLNPEHYNRYPAEFSGGQRQRVGIARALAVNPKLLICDEPVSALDVSVQAQVINLLKDLQAQLDLTCIFISHDLGVVEHVSDRVAVMYLGKVVELAPADALYREPRHPYAAALLSAASVTDPDLARQRRRLHHRGRHPLPGRPADRLPVPPPLPARPGPVPGHRAGAGVRGRRRGAPDRLPFPHRDAGRPRRRPAAAGAGHRTRTSNRTSTNKWRHRPGRRRPGRARRDRRGRDLAGPGRLRKRGLRKRGLRKRRLRKRCGRQRRDRGPQPVAAGLGPAPSRPGGGDLGRVHPAAHPAGHLRPGDRAPGRARRGPAERHRRADPRRAAPPAQLDLLVRHR